MPAKKGKTTGLRKVSSPPFLGLFPVLPGRANISRGGGFLFFGTDKALLLL
jgi:hypothetical protein